jgi:cob(I)alamin adenosyltransferase
MRYVISTNDEQGIIGIAIAKWAKEGKLAVVEKSDTLVEIQASLDRVAAALGTLKKAGYNSEVMQIYLKAQTHLRKDEIANVLYYQEKFLKQIGALK